MPNSLKPKPTRPELKELTANKTPAERREIYHKLGVSPAGVIDGIYNDTYLPEDGMYNDAERDWETDA